MACWEKVTDFRQEKEQVVENIPNERIWKKMGMTRRELLRSFV